MTPTKITKIEPKYCGKCGSYLVEREIYMIDFDTDNYDIYTGKRLDNDNRLLFIQCAKLSQYFSPNHDQWFVDKTDLGNTTYHYYRHDPPPAPIERD